MTPAKLDLKRELYELYRARREPTMIDVPELQFAMIDGVGDPATAKEYRAALEALYAVTYTVKFAVKHAPGGIDFAVMPLEGLWWAPDMRAFATAERSAWQWTMMILQPDAVMPDLFAAARDQAATKKKLDAIARVRLERFAEGRAAQILHIGPYSAEAPTIERLHAFIAEQGAERAGKHHEIYLGDPRRTAPERLRTIIRQPVA